MSLAASHERNSLYRRRKARHADTCEPAGADCAACIWRNGSLLYIDHAFSSAPLSVIAPLYEPVSVNVSASAKVILAYLPENERMAAVEQCTFPNLTKNTITDPSDFLQEIERSRTSGYGFDNEEFSLGIGCLAVPIFDGKKACIGGTRHHGSIQAYGKNRPSGKCWTLSSMRLPRSRRGLASHRYETEKKMQTESAVGCHKMLCGCFLDIQCTHVRDRCPV